MAKYIQNFSSSLIRNPAMVDVYLYQVNQELWWGFLPWDDRVQQQLSWDSSELRVLKRTQVSKNSLMPIRHLIARQLVFIHRASGTNHGHSSLHIKSLWRPETFFSIDTVAGNLKPIERGPSITERAIHMETIFNI